MTLAFVRLGVNMRSAFCTAAEGNRNQLRGLTSLSPRVPPILIGTAAATINMSEPQLNLRHRTETAVAGGKRQGASSGGLPEAFGRRPFGVIFSARVSGRCFGKAETPIRHGDW
jgi:hypothetical protein